MKKWKTISRGISVLIVAVTMFVNSGYGQQIIYSTNGFKTPMHYGDHVEFDITNTGSQTVTLLPRYWETGLEDILQDSAHLVSATIQSGNGDIAPRMKWLKMVNFLTHIIKSYNFDNRMEWWAAPDTDVSLLSKQYDMMGFMHGVYFAKCGDFAQMCCQILIVAGVPQDSLRFAILNRHTLFEIKLSNWASVDVDRMPFSMVPDTLEPSGFASVADEQLDTSLFTNNNRYLYGPDSVNLWPFRTVQNYQGLFADTGCTYTPVNVSRPLDVSPSYKLCRGCSLRYSYTESGISVDMETQAGNDLQSAIINDVDVYTQTPDTSYIADIINQLSDYSGMTLTQAQNILNRGNILFYKKIWYPHYSDSIPTLEYIIPPGADTVLISAPLYITGVAGNDAVIEVGDTLLTGGCNEVLWTPNSNNTPVVTDSQVNYCNAKVYPHTDTVVITLGYNPFTNFNFYQGCQFYSSDSGLAIQELYNGLAPVTGISNPVQVNSNLSVYPNPADNVVFISNTGPINTVSVFDLTGRQVQYYEASGQDKSEISFQALPAGVYFIEVNSGGEASRRVKVIKQ